MISKIQRLKSILFAIVYLLAIMTTHSNLLNCYGGNTVPVLLKLLLIVGGVGIVTYINSDNEHLITNYPIITTNIVLSILIFDFCVTELSGSIMLYKIWWLASIFVAQATLFLIITISKVNYYKNFYCKFWKSFTPTYLFTFIYCFIRKPFSISRTLNLIPFNRGFKYLMQFIKNPTGTFENPLYFFGNIFYFIPIAFILRTFFPKLKDFHLLSIGCLLPIIIEGYQYIFSCGDVDIDDIILNITGFIIGFLIEKYIKKKLLQNA